MVAVFKEYNLQRHFCSKHESTNQNYVVAELIVKHSKSFSEGEFVRKCFDGVCQIICPEKANEFNQIPFSRHIIECRIEDLSTDLQSKFCEKAKEFTASSIALDESTDVQDMPQLMIFVRGISEDFKITKELVNIASMHGTVKGLDIFNKLIKTFEDCGLGQWGKLFSINTDGAPTMVASHNCSSYQEKST
ncbi:GT2D2 protein, partial [Polyodon spathula]|nr:GT2D2 protein [Polyodon spathula]